MVVIPIELPILRVVNVVIPVTLRSLAVAPAETANDAIVETPVIFRLFPSIVTESLPTVRTPTILTLPSIKTSPPKVPIPANVETPVTFNVVVVEPVP